MSGPLAFGLGFGETGDSLCSVVSAVEPPVEPLSGATGGNLHQALFSLQEGQKCSNGLQPGMDPFVQGCRRSVTS